MIFFHRLDGEAVSDEISAIEVFDERIARGTAVLPLTASLGGKLDSAESRPAFGANRVALPHAETSSRCTATIL